MLATFRGRVFFQKKKALVNLVITGNKKTLNDNMLSIIPTKIF